MDRKNELAMTVVEYGGVPAEAANVLPYAQELAELVLAENDRPMRYALISANAGQTDQIAAYMPGNYAVLGRTAIGASNTVQVLIGGRDESGWTLDGYVLPRLASGMYYGSEIAA
jgi:hypothetical protein